MTFVKQDKDSILMELSAKMTTLIPGITKEQALEFAKTSLEIASPIIDVIHDLAEGRDER